MNTKCMNSVSKLLLIFSLGLIFVGCNSNHRENLAVENVDISSEYDAVAMDAPVGTSNESEMVEPNANTIAVPENLKIIKSASLRYKVKDLQVASKNINLIISQFQGYISDQRAQNDLYQKENRLLIKVPTNNFTTIVDSLGSVAEFIDFENITSQDVTEEYIDIQSRLKTKLEIKERYETILRKNAKTVKDILDTEEKLGAIQQEIESAQGRINYLTNKVTYSTIELTIYETATYKEQPTTFQRSFLSKMKEGFSFGWNLIQQILLAIVYIWPLLIVGGVVVYFVRRRIKK